MSDSVAPTGLLTSSGQGLPSSDSLLKSIPVRPGVPLAPTGIAAESDVRTHSPSAAEPHSPDEPPGWVENLGMLPLGYGDDRLVCMPRDPNCAFVYWDLSQQTIAHAFEGLSTGRAVLKLFHLSGALMREVEVDLGMRSFYLRELPPGAQFRVELWAAGANGARLLKSARPVWLPPSEPSDLLDEQYLHIWLDARLGSANFSGGRPQIWRASSDFPGWNDAQTRPAAAETRLGYPITESGAGKPAAVEQKATGVKP